MQTHYLQTQGITMISGIYANFEIHGRRIFHTFRKKIEKKIRKVRDIFIFLSYNK